MVFDEDFVRNAEIREPSAAERQRAGERARAEAAEAARAAFAGGWTGDEDYDAYAYGGADGYHSEDSGWEHGHGAPPRRAPTARTAAACAPTAAARRGCAPSRGCSPS